MSQYACDCQGPSKQERPEPRPGGYDLKIYGPRGGAVPRLTSLIMDEAHQRVQCQGSSCAVILLSFFSTSVPGLQSALLGSWFTASNGTH